MVLDLLQLTAVCRGFRGQGLQQRRMVRRIRSSPAWQKAH